MLKKSVLLPSVPTTGELKMQVQSACDALGVQYAVVVNNLLKQWLSGKVNLDAELDADFVESAKAAMETEEVQDAFVKLAKNHRQRSYPEALNT